MDWYNTVRLSWNRKLSATLKIRMWLDYLPGQFETRHALVLIEALDFLSFEYALKLIKIVFYTKVAIKQFPC